MKNSVFTAMKLKIYEENVAGNITDSERDEALVALESKKNDEAMDAKKAKDCLEEIAEAFPEVEDEIKEICKKIKDSSKDKDGEDDTDDEDDKKDNEEEMSEAAKELFNLIDSL